MMDGTQAAIIGDFITASALAVSIGFLSWQGSIAKKQVDAANKQITEMEQSRMDMIRPVLVPNGDIPRFFIHDNTRQPPVRCIQNQDDFPLSIRNIGAGSAMNIQAIVCIPMINPEKPEDEWAARHCYRSLEGNPTEAKSQVTFAFQQRELSGNNPIYTDVELRPVIVYEDGVIRHARLTLVYTDLYRRQILSVYDFTEKQGSTAFWRHIHEKVSNLSGQQYFDHYRDSINFQKPHSVTNTLSHST